MNHKHKIEPCGYCHICMKAKHFNEMSAIIQKEFKDVLLTSYQCKDGVVFSPEVIVKFKKFIGLPHKDMMLW